MKIAAAAYPITFHQNWADWQDHVGKWCREGASLGAEVLLFPEYGSLELVSLFEEDIRADVVKQVKALGNCLSTYLETYGQIARELGIVIVAPTLPLTVEGRTVNRAFVFGPNGLAGHQDKWFMTPFEQYEWSVESGNKILTVFETEKGSFGIQICYDCEFPIGSQKLAEAGAKVILIPSCTETIRGATRVHIGARARSLENQCFTVVSQTIGEAQWSPAVDFNYGYTGAYCPPDIGLPDEGILSVQVPNQPGWLVQDFDFPPLEYVREKGTVLNFRDSAMMQLGLADGEAFEIRRVRV